MDPAPLEKADSMLKFEDDKFEGADFKCDNSFFSNSSPKTQKHKPQNFIFLFNKKFAFWQILKCSFQEICNNFFQILDYSLPNKAFLRRNLFFSFEMKLSILTNANVVVSYITQKLFQILAVSTK